MIALEEGTINGIHDTLRWDSIPKKFKTYEIKAWHQDSDLEMAFKNSTVWYFEELAKKIKKRKYKKYLRKSKYGNRKIRQGREYDFWNFGKFKVTPTQQIQLLVDLYEGKLPFKKEHQDTLKALMIETQNEDYTVRSKTGWCYEHKDIGWYIGYWEDKQNIVFFATRIQKELDNPNKKLLKTTEVDYQRNSKRFITKISRMNHLAAS